MRTKIIASAITLSILLALVGAIHTSTTTSTIRYCHYWDGYDYDGCYPISTTTSSSISTSTTSITVSTTTIKQSQNNHNSGSGGQADFYGECVFNEIFNPNAFIVQYWNITSDSVWSLNCITWHAFNMHKDI